jgi:large subunit ribosomal protein L25
MCSFPASSAGSAPAPAADEARIIWNGGTMAEVRIKAERREEAGKGPARRARAAGRVPAILYGGGMDPVAISVDRRELALAYHSDSGTNTLLDIEVDGGRTLALTRDLQRDPVRGTLLHADFIKIERDVRIEVEVPLHLVGESPGVSEGGVLEAPLHALAISVLPGDVPEAVDVDISSLAIGDSLKVADIAVSDKYEVLSDPDNTVAMVAQPISEEELEAMEAAVAEVGPEEVEPAAEEAKEEATEGGEEMAASDEAPPADQGGDEGAGA